VLTEARRLLVDLSTRSDSVLDRAQAAVDRAHEQLDATSTVADGMDELNAGMSQLGAQVSALAGLGRAVATGPAGRAAALVYGVRHAVSLRRDGQAVPANAIASSPKVPNSKLASPEQPGSDLDRRRVAQTGGRR
jgi:X-X-X-Leu-X-X-Gly heptad repeat protein